MRKKGFSRLISTKVYFFGLLFLRPHTNRQGLPDSGRRCSCWGPGSLRRHTEAAGRDWRKCLKMGNFELKTGFFFASHTWAINVVNDLCIQKRHLLGTHRRHVLELFWHDRKI